MTIRSIQNSESLDTIWDELIYTEARLLISPPAREHAPLFKDLLARWEKLSASQRQAWRAEIVAQAGVDTEDDTLDGMVDEIDGALQHATNRDRTTPRYLRYFSRPPSVIIRLGLERELEIVRAWPQSLKTEPEAALQALGKRLEKQIASGDAAVTVRRSAGAARADQRVRDINAFIDAVNGTRQSIYGLLVTRGQKEGRAKTWAEGFFRKRAVGRPAVPADPPTPPAEAATAAA